MPAIHLDAYGASGEAHRHPRREVAAQAVSSVIELTEGCPYELIKQVLQMP